MAGVLRVALAWATCVAALGVEHDSCTEREVQAHQEPNVETDVSALIQMKRAHVRRDEDSKTVVGSLLGVDALTNLDQMRAQALVVSEGDSLSSTTSCRKVVHAKYDERTVEPCHNRVYQEPDSRMLSPEDWEALRKPLNGGYLAKEECSQSLRMYSLSRIYAHLPSFFDAHFPDVTYWMIAGTLLGAARTGVPMPWDTDGDISVNTTQWNTQENFEKLKSIYGEPVITHSANCTRFAKPGGVCFAFHVGEDILFSTFPMPNHAYFNWFARFIDLRTGFFVEIIHKKREAKRTTRARLSGTWLPVPAEPSMMEYLTWEFEHKTDFPLWRMSTEMFECTCDNEQFKDVQVVPDQWSMTVTRSCDAGPGTAWGLAEVDTNTACCRKVADRAKQMLPEDVSSLAEEEVASSLIPFDINIALRPTFDVIPAM